MYHHHPWTPPASGKRDNLYAVSFEGADDSGGTPITKYLKAKTRSRVHIDCTGVLAALESTVTQQQDSKR